MTNETDIAQSQVHDEFQKLKGRFLSSLNHEMRTPLMGIIGMADLLHETSLSGEQKEYVSIVRSCADALNETLNATLEYASLRSGQVRREDAPFPLLPCLEALATEYTAKARQKGLQFSFQAGGILPEAILGDEIRMRALLGQLLNNAVKFTAAGKVEMNVVGRGGDEGPAWLDIEVQDTGLGIPPEKMGSLFESFNADRGSESGIVQQHSGLGLGLALARELALLLGGEIAASSALTQGTVFRLRLPIQATSENAPLRALAAATATLAMPVGPDRPRILLVEDNRVSQRIVSHMLGRADFHAVTVDNGLEAVRLASEQQYALVLMDLHMPGIDGIETTYRLRRLAGYAHTPVVALTANAGPEFRELCREHGFQGFLSKPVQSDELVRTIEEALVARAAAG